MDENFMDALDLMDIGISFDGIEKIYQDLGKACEVKKLVQISSKCLDFARKVADEVASDWFDTDLDASDSVFNQSLINEESKLNDKLDCKISENENPSDGSNVNDNESEEDLIGGNIEREISTEIQSDKVPLAESEQEDKDTCTPNEIYEPSTSQDYNSHVGTSIKIDERTTDRTNSIDFLKPHEFDIKGFEDVDLQDGWDDDVDYDIALASYHESNNKNNRPFKIKAAVKFISKLRQSKKLGSRVSKITELPLNPSTETDWEIL